MMKFVFALVPLLALCYGQSLPNSNQLDPRFKLSWEVMSSTSEILFEIDAQTLGWVSLLITYPDGYRADLFWGSSDGTPTGSYLSDMHFNLTSAGPGLGHTYPLVDAEQNLNSQSISTSATNTVIRFSRPLNTEDADDVIIGQGNYLIGWALGETIEAPYVHSATGFVNNVFIP